MGLYEREDKLSTENRHEVRSIQNRFTDSHISILNQFKKFLDAAYRKKLK
jgi:hypothetical protein